MILQHIEEPGEVDLDDKFDDAMLPMPYREVQAIGIPAPAAGGSSSGWSLARLLGSRRRGVQESQV